MLLGLGMLAWNMSLQSVIPGVNSNKYQTVFLRDKYVYIDKLTDAGSGYYKLTSVFYSSSQKTNTEDGGKKTTLSS